jgi:hypothetical protein
MSRVLGSSVDGTGPIWLQIVSINLSNAETSSSIGMWPKYGLNREPRNESDSSPETCFHYRAVALRHAHLTFVQSQERLRSGGLFL